MVPAQSHAGSPLPAQASVAARALPAEAQVAHADETFAGLRVVRTLAMLSIIGHHILWEPLFGVAFGVTSLQVVMCALQTRQVEARPLAGVARRRAARLLAPWLAWSAVYALVELVEAWRWGQPVGARFDASSWIVGASYHLWFLPFAFLACLAANRAQARLAGRSAALAVLIPACAGALLVLVAPHLNRALDPPRPFDTWIDGAGTIALGVALGRVLALRRGAAREPWLLAVLFVGALPLFAGPALLGPTALQERYGVALCLAVGGFLWRGRDSRLLARLADLNLGVYLVHALVLRAMQRLPAFEEAGLAVHLAACYGLCLLVVAGLRRLRLPHLV